MLGGRARATSKKSRLTPPGGREIVHRTITSASNIAKPVHTILFMATAITFVSTRVYAVTAVRESESRRGSPRYTLHRIPAVYFFFVGFFLLSSTPPPSFRYNDIKNVLKAIFFLLFGSFHAS